MYKYFKYFGAVMVVVIFIYGFFSLRGSIEDLKMDMANNFLVMRGEMADMRGEMADNFLVVRGEIARSAAERNSVRIKISPPTDRNSTYACGATILVRGNKYVITNRHVLINETGNCTRQIVELQFANHSLIAVDISKPILFSKKVDLALIPVNVAGSIDSGRRTDLPKGGTPLYSMAYRENLTMYQTCHVLTTDSSAMNESESDCEGTHGFS
jgi:hypothetical protein